MRIIYQTISAIALAATILPSVCYLAGRMELDRVKWVMLAATLAWFAVTPLWMERKTQPADGQSRQPRTP